MKPIGLSLDQKNKLIKMCTKLFPEYNRIEFNNYGTMILFKQILTPTRNYDYTHWFEFCINHLSEKILSDEENSYIDDASELMIFQGIRDSHPVDYLYEEFKKLKL